mgnify:CR=1 FL=1
MEGREESVITGGYTLDILAGSGLLLVLWYVLIAVYAWHHRYPGGIVRRRKALQLALTASSAVITAAGAAWLLRGAALWMHSSGLLPSFLAWLGSFVLLVIVAPTVGVLAGATVIVLYRRHEGTHQG